jgi:hypothetical protein
MVGAEAADVVGEDCRAGLRRPDDEPTSGGEFDELPAA